MEEKIGSYRIVRKIGEGGMGAVFEAVHEQIGRRAAIKILHKEVSENPEMLARFYNEARAANMVSHPSILEVYEIGQLPDSRAYIIMQYLDGQSLAESLQHDGGRMAYLRAIRLIRQTAAAMAEAHDKGIIHRDLKPSNVTLERENQTTVPRQDEMLAGNGLWCGTTAGRRRISSMRTLTGELREAFVDSRLPLLCQGTAVV